MQLPALLIEVDRATGFSEEFTHAGGAQPRNPSCSISTVLVRDVG